MRGEQPQALAPAGTPPFKLLLLQVCPFPRRKSTATATPSQAVVRAPVILSPAPVHSAAPWQIPHAADNIVWWVHAVLRVHWCCFCRRQAPVAAVFAGSPQLMGVIKLCTGWMVSSLPLYNDDDLLKRNENVSIQFHKCGISQELSSFSPKCNAKKSNVLEGKRT